MKKKNERMKEHIVKLTETERSLLRRLLQMDEKKWREDLKAWEQEKQTILDAGMSEKDYEENRKKFEFFAERDFQIHKKLLDEVLTYDVTKDGRGFKVAVSK